MIISGCASLRGNLEADPIPEFTVDIPWMLTDCTFAVAILSVSVHDLGDRVPEGFRVLPISEIPGFPVPDSRADGNLGIELFRCASGSTMNATVNMSDVSYGSAFTFVEPPVELRHPNATYHFVKFDTLVADAELRELLVNETIPAVAGNVTFSNYQNVGPGLNFLQGSLQLGNQTVGFSANTGTPGAGDPFTFVEFQRSKGGYTQWLVNVTSTSSVSGAGFLDLSGATWLKTVGGGDRAEAYYMGGVGSFEGRLLVPGHE